MGSIIPMTWYFMTERIWTDKRILVGRILQWITMVETQRAGNIYDPNEPTIPKNGGQPTIKRIVYYCLVSDQATIV